MYLDKYILTIAELHLQLFIRVKQILISFGQAGNASKIATITFCSPNKSTVLFEESQSPLQFSRVYPPFNSVGFLKAH